MQLQTPLPKGKKKKKKYSKGCSKTSHASEYEERKEIATLFQSQVTFLALGKTIPQTDSQ